MDYDLLLAPNIPGLTKSIQALEEGNSKVVYLANAENPYGLAEGTYSGEYKRNVIVNEVEVGGVALVPTVSVVILENELSLIPQGEAKLKLILPFDFSQVGENVVNVSEQTVDYGIEVSGILIECAQESNIIWTIPDTEVLYVSSASAPTGETYDAMFDIFNMQFEVTEGSPSGLPLANGEFYELTNNTMSNDNIMRFVQIIIYQGAFSSQNEEGTSAIYMPDFEKYFFGLPLYDSALTARGTNIFISVGETLGENRYTLDASDLLTIGNSIVLMTSEKP
jgi:hypothetical protein